MKKLSILLLALMWVGAVFGQESKPAPKIAVYATGNVSEGHKRYMANAVEDALIKNGNVEVLPRQSAVLEQLAKERGYQLGGNVSDVNIAKLGIELGANIICVVEVNDFLGLEINARSINVELNKAVRSARTDLVDDLNDKEQLRKAAQEIVSQLMGSSSGGSTTTNRPASTPSGKNLTFTANGVSFEMIFVEGGTFVMGCTSEQGSDCYDHEKPTHSVTLSNYYMGKYQVTQKLWQAVMGTTIVITPCIISIIMNVRSFAPNSISYYQASYPMAISFAYLPKHSGNMPLVAGKRARVINTAVATI